MSKEESAKITSFIRDSFGKASSRKLTEARKNSLKKSQISYGLIIDDRILFTADAQYNRPQLEFLLKKYNKIEVVFHDCDIKGFSRGVHAAYDELVTLPAEIRAKTYLCHYSEAVNTIDALVDGFAGLAKHWVYYDFD